MQGRFAAYLVIMIAVFGMAAAKAGDAMVVPLVGCPSDGQTGPTPAPTGSARTITLDFKLPGPIAFYQGASGIGVFAPAGWHCLALSGSDGDTIIVSPHAFPKSGIPSGSVAAPVMELSRSDGETSGRFTVAKYGWLLFPDLTKDFVKHVEDEGLVPKSDIEVPPSPTDYVNHLNPRLVNFETPAKMPGIGSAGLVKIGLTPISGLVALSEDGLVLSILRISMDKEDGSFFNWSRILLMLNTPCVTGDVCSDDSD